MITADLVHVTRAAVARLDCTQPIPPSVLTAIGRGAGALQAAPPGPRAAQLHILGGRIGGDLLSLCTSTPRTPELVRVRLMAIQAAAEAAYAHELEVTLEIPPPPPGTPRLAFQSGRRAAA